MRTCFLFLIAFSFLACNSPKGPSNNQPNSESTSGCGCCNKCQAKQR